MGRVRINRKQAGVTMEFKLAAMQKRIDYLSQVNVNLHTSINRKIEDATVNSKEEIHLLKKRVEELITLNAKGARDNSKLLFGGKTGRIVSTVRSKSPRGGGIDIAITFEITNTTEAVYQEFVCGERKIPARLLSE